MCQVRMARKGCPGGIKVGRATVRILLSSIYYAPEVTGNAPYATGVAEHWASQGHSVHVMTGVPHYPQWRRAVVPRADDLNPRISRYDHYIPQTHNAFARLVYEASWLASAARGLASGRFDVAVGITPTLSGAVLASFAGRRFGIPFGLVFQDLMGPAARQSGYQGSRGVARYVQAVEKAIGRRARSIAIVADNFRDYLERAGIAPDRIVRVRNWSHAVEPDESRDETRRRLGWLPSAFVCLHAGNMGRKQGLDNLLECAKLIRDQDVWIVLAGDGNERERLVAAAHAHRLRNVSFIVAPQLSPQFAAMLRAADLLILNQRASVGDMSLPSKLAAYFAADRPVVAAVAPDSSAGRELAIAGAGIVVPPGEPGELVRTIQMLKASPKVREQLGANGKAYSLHYLSRDRALSDYDDFLAALTGQRETAAAATLGN